MGGCFVPHCHHNNEKNSCSFYRFPAEKISRAKWAKLIDRKDAEPYPNSKVCSCHFVNGKKENFPTIFYHCEKRQGRSSPKRIKRETQFRYSPHVKEESDVDEPTSLTDTDKDIKEEPQPSTSSSALSTCSIEEVLAVNFLLQQQIDSLKKEVMSLKKQPFSYSLIKEDDKLVSHYTGLPNDDMAQVFFALFEDLEMDPFRDQLTQNISRNDQIFITLMRLRRGFSRLDLSIRFGISEAAISNIVTVWIHVIHHILSNLMNSVPSQLNNRGCWPRASDRFNSCKMILDCTEVFIDTPDYRDIQNETHRQYRHHTTFKGLVGVAPNGAITFCSKLYPGSTTDKDIVRRSGVLNKFDPGDLILANKGFLITDLFPQGVPHYQGVAKVLLYKPPFVTTPQFTPNQVYETQNIARAKMHFERSIRRVKCYKILNHIPRSLFFLATKIWQISCYMVNFQSPLIKEIEQFC